MIRFKPDFCACSIVRTIPLKSFLAWRMMAWRMMLTWGWCGIPVPLEPIMGQMGTVSSPRVQVRRLSHPQCCPQILFNCSVCPCIFAPFATLRLRPMHQDCIRSRGEAMPFVYIDRQTQSISNLDGFDDLCITGEVTFVDQVVELATIRCGEVEVLRQVQTYKQVQRFAVAVEINRRICDCYHHPCLQIGSIEEITRLMNANPFVLFLQILMQFGVDKVGKVAVLHNIQNLLKILCTVEEYLIILHLRGCSKAPELSMRTIRNLATLRCHNCHAFAEHRTRASLACGQVEDQGVLIDLGVAGGEVQCHESFAVDLISVGHGWGTCECPVCRFRDRPSGGSHHTRGCGTMLPLQQSPAGCYGLRSP